MPARDAVAVLLDWDGNVVSCIYPNEVEYDPIEYRRMLDKAADMMAKVMGD